MFVRGILAGAIAALAVGWFAHSSPGAGPERSYRVQTGDTLWSIAERYYGDSGDLRRAVWQLRERNELSNATITPGQRLVLP
jgi:LysM repeat protein